MKDVPCCYPSRADHDTLPEGWDEWRTSDRCTHAECMEIESYKQPYRSGYSRAEREELEADRELMRDEFHVR